jgi:polysaccharide deacetylase family protein (PEP-CTERM system associated)
MDSLTIDVEEWFHILDSDAVPGTVQWPDLQSRLDPSVDTILELLDRCDVKATFFWLGWVAERHRALLRRCAECGHEIASHGHAHVLPYRVGAEQFRADIVRAKAVLEDLSGRRVTGFRAAGFGITEATPWAFDTIKGAGYLYDASVFPARHGHGGQAGASLDPHFVGTRHGSLFEAPPSVIEILGRRASLFGGGYLRLAPQAMIRWGAARLKAEGRPLIVYFHPRDIDPDQPRLPLPLVRRFKCYVNLHSTLDKIKWLCENHGFGTMHDLMNTYLIRSSRPVDDTSFTSSGCQQPAQIHTLPESASP